MSDYVFWKRNDLVSKIYNIWLFDDRLKLTKWAERGVAYVHSRIVIVQNILKHTISNSATFANEIILGCINFLWGQTLERRNNKKSFETVMMFSSICLAVTHLVPNTYGPRTFGPQQLVPNWLVPNWLVPLDKRSSTNSVPMDKWFPKFCPPRQMVPRIYP